MAVQIIENDKEVYLTFSNVIMPEDIASSRMFHILSSDKPLTIVLDNAVWSEQYKDLFVGIVMLGEFSENVKIKGLKEEYKNSLDKLLKL